jgi:hypothetical protein
VKPDDDHLFYLSAGPLAAIALGVALMPLRGVTTAANLSFAFMALTLVAAELGGGRAAILTALVSALSLDFFLTEPYLRLAIDDKHDVVAFLGLAVCGLIVASLASQRAARIAALTKMRAHRELLHEALVRWHPTLPLEPQLARVLRGACDVLPLSAAVVRDDRGNVLACSSDEAGARPLPTAIVDPEAPSVAGPLPEAGGRIPLPAGAHRTAWMDVWGDGGHAGLESRRAVADVARLVGLILAGYGYAAPERPRPKS